MAARRLRVNPLSVPIPYSIDIFASFKKAHRFSSPSSLPKSHLHDSMLRKQEAALGAPGIAPDALSARCHAGYGRICQRPLWPDFLQRDASTITMIRHKMPNFPFRMDSHQESRKIFGVPIARCGQTGQPPGASRPAIRTELGHTGRIGYRPAWPVLMRPVLSEEAGRSDIAKSGDFSACPYCQ